MLPISPRTVCGNRHNHCQLALRFVLAPAKVSGWVNEVAQHAATEV